MIVDCFTFSDELDLLELRLNVLSDVVDHFVLVESPVTFTNHPKPLYYAANRDRFAAWADRIIHVVVDDMPTGRSAWDREYHQRNAIRRGLIDCSPGDWILVSDVDEIPSPQRIADIRYRRAPYGNHGWRQFAFEQALYSLTLNWRHPQPWYGTRAVRYRDLGMPQHLRSTLGPRAGEVVLPHGGWSYSSFGGVDAVQAKLRAFSHQEVNTPELNNPEHIAHVLRTGQRFAPWDADLVYEPFGDQHPAWLVANCHRFEHWLSDRQLVEGWAH